MYAAAKVIGEIAEQKAAWGVRVGLRGEVETVELSSVTKPINNNNVNPTVVWARSPVDVFWTKGERMQGSFLRCARIPNGLEGISCIISISFENSRFTTKNAKKYTPTLFTLF